MAKEKVCYILGAGFSRPLGLPLMNDFLSLAKDMYFKDGSKYEYFKDIFKMFDEFSKIHNYMKSDQLNIEELLSLADMKDYVQGTRRAIKIKKFIIDVIGHYTPELNVVRGIGAYKNYIGFVSAMASCQARDQKYEYSIVTLNYDTIIENVIDSLREVIAVDIYNDRTLRQYAVNPPIAKLHGCVRGENIQTPTWNKGGNKDFQQAWRLAHESLSSANHLRIIGYSLPESDSYIKYLLKIAMLNVEHLKTIDVVCLDDASSSVEKRYSSFIGFRDWKYINANTEQYLATFYSSLAGGPGGVEVSGLKDGHANFIKKFNA